MTPQHDDDSGSVKIATEAADVLPAMTWFITERLIKTISIGDERFRALAETAERFNDTSCLWAYDNAKAAELLCASAYYDQNPEPGDSALDFVLRISFGAIIQRRCGPPELRVLSSDARAFRVETAFFIVEGDLSLGLLRQSLQFNDGRTIVAAQHTSNVLHYRYEGRAHTMDVENTVEAFAIEDQAGKAITWHSGAIVAHAGSVGCKSRRLSTLRYQYKVDAEEQSIATKVELVVADVVMFENVVLSTALDQLSKSVGVDYRCVSLRTAGVDHVNDRGTGKRQALHMGPADYIGVSQVGASPGFSYGIHILVQRPELLRDVTAVDQKAGMLHWLGLSYAVGTVPPGGRVSVTEKRMLTGGVYHDELEHYETALRQAGGGAYDPSMTYDICAELNAVAVQIVPSNRGCYIHPPSPERIEQLTSWYDRHLERYFEFIRPEASDDLSRVLTRGIGYVVLSLDYMFRATGYVHFRERMEMAVQLILRGARRLRCGRDEHDLTFGDVWASHVPFLDNHAACLLGLVRGSYRGDTEGKLARAITEAVLGIKLHTAIVTAEPTAHNCC